MDMTRETTLQELGRHLVMNEVRYCVSSLISELMKGAFQEGALIDEDDALRLSARAPDAGDYRNADDVSVKGKPAYDVESDDQGFRWTELEPIILDGEPAEKGDWFESELEAWRDLFEFHNLDTPEGSEIFEHWLVSDWLAGKLEEKGESIARDVQGLTVWGRATTGQAMACDYVIQQIALETYGEPQPEPAPTRKPDPDAMERALCELLENRNADYLHSEDRAMIARALNGEA